MIDCLIGLAVNFGRRELSRQYADDVIGLLNITIVDAKLTRDTEMFGKMDPYLDFSINGVHLHKTAVKDEAGKTPVWNEAVAQ